MFRIVVVWFVYFCGGFWGCCFFTNLMGADVFVCISVCFSGDTDQATKDQNAMGRGLLCTISLGIYMKHIHRRMCEQNDSIGYDNSLTTATHGRNQTFHNMS